jgi:hypothetical protein
MDHHNAFAACELKEACLEILGVPGEKWRGNYGTLVDRAWNEICKA